jgi:hypothetical protein
MLSVPIAAFELVFHRFVVVVLLLVIVEQLQFVVVIPDRPVLVLFVLEQ